MPDTADPARSRTVPQTARKSISPKESNTADRAGKLQTVLSHRSEFPRLEAREDVTWSGADIL